MGELCNTKIILSTPPCERERSLFKSMPDGELLLVTIRDAPHQRRETWRMATKKSAPKKKAAGRKAPARRAANKSAPAKRLDRIQPIEDMPPLTDQAFRFAQEYMIDCNAAQAAIRAG